MSYSFDRIQDTNFCCIHGLVDDLLTQINEKDDVMLTVVGDQCLTEDLIKLFANLEDEDGISFEFASLDFDKIGYDKEYYFTITSDYEIWVEKAYQEAAEEHEAGYLFTGSDITYIYADLNSKVLQDLDDGENNILIFGFGED
jgi:hypothetical protein